jgi:hypothetical protein
MKRLALAVAGVAATAGLTGGAAILPGSAAQDAATTTRHYVLHQTGTHNTGKFTFAGTDKIRHGDKVVGFDAITGRFYPRQDRVVIRVSFALRGGMILARVHNLAFTPGGPTEFAGRITGGTGKYRGIDGTITAHSPAGNSKKTFVTLAYTM